MTKYFTPKRYMSDYRKSMSHEQAYMQHKVNGQSFVSGELYDQMYLNLRTPLLLNFLLLVWFIAWVVL